MTLNLNNLLMFRSLILLVLEFVSNFVFRPFARSGHMVWNKLCWDANNAVGLPKQKNSYQSRGPFLEGLLKFSHPESHIKLVILLITDLFHSHIFNTDRGFLHTRSFRPIHFPAFRYRWTKSGFTGLKIFQGFRETRPSLAFFVWKSHCVIWVPA